jgi:phenylpropionate dioxygenase-like ring-hydroxylating dioxygenase large terminal subunit
MLRPEDNERVTRVSKGTPMGELFRRYWIPALLSEELQEKDGAPVRVRLLGEDLIAFRDSNREIGLLDAYCPHRRAPMFFGRNEDCGLRCVYHGWKFDRHGNCTDMPSEPAGTPLQAKVKIASYPIVERGGIIWTYMGPKDTMPEPPDYEWMRAPQSHRFVSKTFEDCNWLQAMEGGLDTAHSSFVHNEFIGNEASLRNQDRSPRIEVERTDYGYYYVSTRSLKDGSSYCRLYHYVMPNQQMRSGTVKFLAGAGDEDPHAVPKMDGHFWVPIDDEHTYVYNWSCAVTENGFPDGWIERWESFMGRGADDLIPGTYRLKRNLANDYMIDRELQRTKTYSGIKGLNTQDYALQEGMGPIVDRSKEFLGTSDRAIVAMRRQLIEATHQVERGERPPAADPATHRNIRPVDRILDAGQAWKDVFAKAAVPKW